MEILLTFVLLGILAWAALRRGVRGHEERWREQSTMFMHEAGLWPVSGQPVAPRPFERLSRGLRGAAGVIGRPGHRVIAWRAGRSTSGRIERWLVAPADDAMAERVAQGQVGLRIALDTTPLWVIDRDHQGHCIRAWQLAGLDGLPPDVRPDANAYVDPPAGASGAPLRREGRYAR